MMRLAFVCMDRGVPVFGTKGSSIHVQEILHSFLKKGFSVKLFARKIGGEKPKKFEDIDVYEVPIHKNNSKEDYEIRDVNSILKQMILDEGPFDFIYERYSLWSYSGMDYAAKHNIPGILEVNSPLIEEQSLYRGPVDREKAQDVAKRAFDSAQLIIAVSQGVKSYLENFPVTKNKVKVIPNGVDPNNFVQTGEISRKTDRPFTVGFVGTLKPWHGLSTIIESLAYLHKQNQEIHLLIVGDGPEKDALTKKLDELNLLSKVQFTGPVSHQAVPSLLTQMDVALAPYPKIKNFYFSPLKVFEYMMGALPVIASKIGQLNEIIENEKTGFLVPPGDAVAIAKTIIKLKENPKLRYSIGRAARANILKNYTWDMTVDKILYSAGIAQQYQICRGAKFE